MLRSPRLVGCALALGACAESAIRGRSDETFVDSGTPTTTTSDSGAPTQPPVATWYHLDATFVVAGGAIDPAQVAVTATLHAEDGAPLCRHTVPVVATDRAPRPAADADLLSYWSLTLGDGVPEGSCAPFPARTVWWGVGPYDPALDPARVAAGLGAATAYAGVVREDEGGPTWLVALVGTSDQLAGYTPASPARPLPDGAYEWVGLVVLPLPPAAR